MADDLVVWHLAGNAVTFFIGHNRRHAHYEAAVAQNGLQSLNGMTGSTGKAVAVKAAVHIRARI